MIALYSALGAAQIATISAQKFADGGKISGPSHANGGVLAVIDGRPVAEIEGDEYVVNKRATSRNLDAAEALNRHGAHMDLAVVPANSLSKFQDGGVIETANFDALNRATEANQTNAILSDILSANREFLEKEIIVAVRDIIAAEKRVKTVDSQSSVG